ncbi:hypothetical protein SAMN04487820_109166 [Actinopolyspora mzabensis]|uniref:Uncharacterized protein n=2 Tax=Actinopolyspora TaxID=1849 RepID=A0A1G9CZ19_ACTMZ|nr:hypothetical protein [Actinopolyspora mzabensis]SDK56956.1 hypothetical protein SAMN04487820_109166 [Actinopolyspora mzabensis]
MAALGKRADSAAPATAPAVYPSEAAHEREARDMNEQYSPNFKHGPNTVCPNCGGFQKVSEPRLYMIRATEETHAGMTLGEWRTCPQCQGDGHTPGLRPPV